MRAKDTLFEYYEDALEQPDAGYVSSADDNEIDKENKKSTRRPRLTLRHINKLRKVRKLKRLEKIKHSELVARMYGNKSDEEM